MDEDNSEHAISHHSGAKFCPKQLTHPRDDAREVKPAKPPKPARKRNVIVVNDIEIELDDDEEDNEPPPAPAPAVPCSSDLDLQLPKLSLDAARNPDCTKNLKPPETETSTETKAHRFTTSGHLSRSTDVGHSGFALHTPLRFKRRSPTIDISSNFTYTGQS